MAVKKLSKSDVLKVTTAIKDAETLSHAKIRVHVRAKLKDDLMKEAVAKFNDLGLAETEEQNAILLFVACEDRQFTIIGDEALQAEVDEAFWKKSVAAIVKRFKAGDFADGLVAGVKEIGKAMAAIHEDCCHDHDEPLTFS